MKCARMLFLAVATAVSGQNISGTVTSQSGSPLPGVVVRLVSAKVADTTGADGKYSLTVQVSIAPTVESYVQAIADIRYLNGRFIFKAHSHAAVKASLYSPDGRFIGTVVDGRLKQGVTEVPFAMEKFGKRVYILTVKSCGVTRSYRFLPFSGSTFQVSGLSGGFGMSKAVERETIDWLQATKEGYAAYIRPVEVYNGIIDITLSGITAPDFGPNVLLFDTSMQTAAMQSQITDVFTRQERSQFGSDRYAFFFKPGAYTLDVNVGYYTEPLGLGLSPDEVVITGAVHAEADWFNGNATHNFWRSCANIAVVPASGDMNRWAVSQAAPFRRMHIKGNLVLDDGGWSSGGFIADSKIDGEVRSGSQQQWFSRNSEYGSWNGGVWNMFFLGVENAPSGTWPQNPYTVIDRTPVLREKPFLHIDEAGNYFVRVPLLESDSRGISWSSGTTAGESIPIDLFHIARSDRDSAGSINAALNHGKNVLFTPGIYRLNQTLSVTRPGTVVLGIGLATLVPENGITAMSVADVDGITIAGILFDAGITESPTLLQVGETGAAKDHSEDPVVLNDVFLRVGGAGAGIASNCLTINSNNVIVDHAWIWRADHGSGVGWTVNRGKNGLIVNGDNVTIYGLFVEHYQEFQTLWNGNSGRVYFYQCEMPYDPPSQAAWQLGSVKGYAGYKVADSVTTHEGWGMGVYCAFHNPVEADNAFEVSTAAGIRFHHLVTICLGGSQGAINNVINGTGGAVNSATTKRTVTDYP